MGIDVIGIKSHCVLRKNHVQRPFVVSGRMTLDEPTPERCHCLVVHGKMLDGSRKFTLSNLLGEIDEKFASLKFETTNSAYCAGTQSLEASS
jgi:hypothetical protein